MRVRDAKTLTMASGNISPLRFDSAFLAGGLLADVATNTNPPPSNVDVKALRDKAEQR